MGTSECPGDCTGPTCQSAPWNLAFNRPNDEGLGRCKLVLIVDVTSDVICPWCFIGKRRLEKALKLLCNPPGVQVIWRPFQLNPQMPAEGIERRAYRIGKFGSWEQSQALDAKGSRRTKCRLPLRSLWPVAIQGATS